MMLLFTVPDEALSLGQHEQKITGTVIKVDYIGAGTSTLLSSGGEHTIVRFKDGRIKPFRQISGAMFHEGKINIITYDTMHNTIITVEIKP